MKKVTYALVRITDECTDHEHTKPELWDILDSLETGVQGLSLHIGPLVDNPNMALNSRTTPPRPEPINHHWNAAYLNSRRARRSACATHEE